MEIPGSYRGSASGRKPAESRRWLKPRVPKEQLYKLAPRAPRPKPFARLGGPFGVRTILRSWRIWLVVAILLYWSGYDLGAAGVAILAYILFHTAAQWHPAIYPLDAPVDIASEGFHITMAGVTGMPLVPGNRVTLYNNGDEFFPAMLDAIESARESVTMEQYIFWDGQVGRRFAEAFAQKAREGVPVKLLLDAIGSATLGKENFQILEAAGCQLAWFQPIHWYTLERAHRRNHRKSVIIDGRIAFTGGAGFGDQWLGAARNSKEWRDIQIGIEGPAAAAQQTGFVQNWLATTGEIVAGPRYFPFIDATGDVEVQTILSSPISGAGAVGTMYLVALQSAQRSISIANPYFIPDARVVGMLAAAHQRGVLVRLLVAGRHNDTWWARQNSVRRYGELLRAGVEIHEYQPTMLHQKIMIVDDVWATAGTANFDNRSFALNEETNVCIHDRAVVAELCRSFEADIELSRQIHLRKWKRRGLWQRAKEEWAALAEDQM